MLVRQGAELCFECHATERDRMADASVHAPFADGDCATCHAPHASGRPALLTSAPRALCAECHDGGDSGMRAAHPFGTGSLDCTSCHSPHSSGQAKLIRDQPHAVFDTCGRCHEAGGGLLAAGDQLCLRCHAEVGREAERPDAHPALGEGCLTCHTPHAADRVGLIRGGSDRPVCLSCHAEVERSQQGLFSVHPERGEAGACSACHTGHRSDQKALLRDAPEKVCASCHAGHSQFGHPLGAGVVDPRSGVDMSCQSCHRPHGTMFPSLLTHSPQRSLCVQCHADGSGARGAHAGNR